MLNPLDTTIFLNCKQAAQLIQVNERTIRRNILDGRLNADAISGNAGGGTSGLSYRIPLDSLPAEAQIKYWEQVGHEASSGEAVEEAFDLAAYKAKAGEDGMAKLLDRQKAVLQLIGYRESSGEELTSVIERIAGEHGMSSMTLRRLEARYRENGLAGLVRSGRSDKGESRSMCLEARRMIGERYLDANKRKANEILDTIRDEARELGTSACRECPYNPASKAYARIQDSDDAQYFPACDEVGQGIRPPANRHAVNRVLASIGSEVESYARYGRRDWEANHMMKGLRKKPDMVNECWFGDHHQFDVFVLDEHSKPVRPWLTAWYDIGSGVLVGWCISLNPNSETITTALVRAIAKKPGSEIYGAPVWAYMDNGKDYRSKRFEGDEESEYWRRRNPDLMGEMYLRIKEGSVMQALRIQAVHAKAYHGWAKPVERFFRTLEERYCRQLRGYCGGKPADRAENFDRALKHWVEKGELMTMDEFVDVFQNQILPAYHAHPHSGYNGETPAERYRRLPKARSEIYSWALLDEVWMQHAERVVTTQGIKFRGKLFWSPELMHYAKERVIIKFSDFETDRITVRRADDGTFICEAEIREGLSYVGEDPERVAEITEMQKRQEREVQQKIRAYGVKQPGKRASGSLYAEAVDEDEKGNITHMEAERTARRKAEGRKKSVEADDWSVADEYFLRLGTAAVRKQG